MLDVNLMKHCGMRGLVDKGRVEADGGTLRAAVWAAVAQGENTHVLVLIFYPKCCIWSSQHWLKYTSGGVSHAC